jgi:hypothetical protein
MDFVEAWVYDRPDLSLVLGPRGGGKSYMAAFATRIDSVRYDDHDTKILGGSEAQSLQIYQALRDYQYTRPGMRQLDVINQFSRERCTFTTGSTVDYIPASHKSVRGPHVPSLRLDEVDEMDPDIRESALGMCMELGGVPASISMTSTWHRVGGPMSELIAKGEAGAFPVYRFCIFEVLERCPTEISGKHLEKCSECPIVKWCHSDIERTGKPKAKRSNGHYTIKSLIQKVKGLSARVFESDFLCLGPRADGVWFTQFSDANVTVMAEYDPMLPVYISVDSGVHTGAVFLQYRETKDGPKVNIFAEYYRESSENDTGAEVAALAILDVFYQHCGAARRFVSTDSAGGARNPVGPTVLAEYERCGLKGTRGIEQWQKYPGCVAPGLATVEAMVRSADGSVSLTVHPRCKHVLQGFRGYARAKVGGVFQDYPPRDQHPYEDMIDPIRGVLSLLMPEGRKPQPRFERCKPGRVF